MASRNVIKTDGSGESTERYVIGDAEAQQAYVQTRRARDWVPFFLPHLQPGMHLLDCGCGVGSITLDLAEIVAPGQVIGIDIDPGQLELASDSARQRGLDNMTFQTGSVYELPFPDATFDAALAHTLLFHLSDPLAALKEIRRVLKPGGVAGIADDDYGTFIFSPASPLADQFMDLRNRFLVHSGASPFYSRHLRRYLLDAGFARTEGHATAVEHYGTLQETRFAADLVVQIYFSQPAFIDTVTDQGWADRATLKAIEDEVIAWGERPDAFAGGMYCAAIGWAPE